MSELHLIGLNYVLVNMGQFHKQPIFVLEHTVKLVIGHVVL